MNTLKKIVSVSVVAATALTAVGAAAQAHEWRGRGFGYAPAPSYYAPAPRPYYGHGNFGHRDRTGDRIAAGVAIGVGAAILGTIIANQHRRPYGY